MSGKLDFFLKLKHMLLQIKDTWNLHTKFQVSTTKIVTYIVYTDGHTDGHTDRSMKTEGPSVSSSVIYPVNLNISRQIPLQSKISSEF